MTLGRHRTGAFNKRHRRATNLRRRESFLSSVCLFASRDGHRRAALPRKTENAAMPYSLQAFFHVKRRQRMPYNSLSATQIGFIAKARAPSTSIAPPLANAVTRSLSTGSFLPSCPHVITCRPS